MKIANRMIALTFSSMEGCRARSSGINDAMSTDVRLLDMPAPDLASTPAELLAAMRALRQWAALTYRELEVRAQRAGDKLPRGLIPSLMANNDLPRESTLASFVRACVGDHAVDQWLAVRRRIAVGSAMSLADQVEAWLTRETEKAARIDFVRAESLAQTSFADGRLARAVANASGDRWVGLHRRPRKPIWPFGRRTGVAKSPV
jgi:hypothetical protein